MSDRSAGAIVRLLQTVSLYDVAISQQGADTAFLKLRTLSRALNAAVTRLPFWESRIQKTLLQDTEKVKIARFNNEDEDEDEDENDQLSSFKLRGMTYQIADMALKHCNVLDPSAPPLCRYLALRTLYNLQVQSDNFGRTVCEYNEGILPVCNLNETLFYRVQKYAGDSSVFTQGRSTEYIPPEPSRKTLVVACTVVLDRAGGPVHFVLEGFTSIQEYNNCPRQNKALLHRGSHKLLLYECDPSTLVDPDSLLVHGTFIAFVESIRQYVKLDSGKSVNFERFEHLIVGEGSSIFLPFVRDREESRIDTTKRMIIDARNFASSMRIAEFTFPRGKEGYWIRPREFYRALAMCIVPDEALATGDINFPARPNALIAFTTLPPGFTGFDGPPPKEGTLISTLLDCVFGAQASNYICTFHPDLPSDMEFHGGPLAPLHLRSAMVYSAKDSQYVSANRYRVLKHMVKQERARLEDSRTAFSQHAAKSGITQDQTEPFYSGFDRIDEEYAIFEKAIAKWEAGLTEQNRTAKK